MQIRVDGDRCQGHGLCNMLAPKLFSLDEEDGHSVPVSTPVDDDERDLLVRAASNCPEQAIVIEG
jgi:ferredoxin